MTENNNNDDRDRKGLDRIFKYISETPEDKYSELTRLYRRQVLPLVWMETTEQGIKLLREEIQDLEDWYIEQYGKDDKGKDKDWAKQIIKERKEGAYDPSMLMNRFRKSLYQHLRSVEGGQLIRLTALAETEMAGQEEEEVEEHISP